MTERVSVSRGAAARGADTRDRIVEAALETVREEGFADTTARAIARHGGFNQALIFYHFGSVGLLLTEAFRRLSARQVARYREPVAEVSSPSDLIAIARQLHDEDLKSCAIAPAPPLIAAANDP